MAVEETGEIGHLITAQNPVITVKDRPAVVGEEDGEGTEGRIRTGSEVETITVGRAKGVDTTELLQGRTQDRFHLVIAFTGTHDHFCDQCSTLLSRRLCLLNHQVRDPYHSCRNFVIM